MKCPNCDFVVATKKDLCPRCELDLRPFKKEHGLKITDPESSFEVLRSREHAEHVQEQQQTKKEKTSQNEPSSKIISPAHFSDKKEIARTKIVIELNRKIPPAKTPQPLPEKKITAAPSDLPAPGKTPIIEKVEFAAEEPTLKGPHFPESTLDELSNSIQENLLEAKSATALLPSKEFSTHAPVIAPKESSSAQFQEMIAYLALDSEEVLKEELLLLDETLQTLQTSSSGYQIAARLQAAETFSTPASTKSLDIDNSSLLDALREYDTAIGSKIGLIDSGDSELEADEEFLEGNLELPSSEEPTSPSIAARLGAIFVDLFVVLTAAILIAFVSVPLPIAKLIFLEHQPLAFQALPHLATYLYCLITTAVIYNTAFTLSGMQTVGAKLFAFEVLSQERSELHFAQALLRSLAINTTALTCGLGLLPAIFKQRALHELLSKTLLQTTTAITVLDSEILQKTVYSIEENE